MAEKATSSGKNKLIIGVSLAQVVDDNVPTIPPRATGVQAFFLVKTG